jgi:enediyne biosynthesis protein E4
MELPTEAQLSAARAIYVEDLNADGHVDLLITGNMFNTEVETERYDAGGGAVLLGNGDGSFSALASQEHGFNTPADARDLTTLKMGNGQTLFLVSNNQQLLQAFFLKSSTQNQQ